MNIDKLGLSFGEQVILKNASCNIGPVDKVGIVGVNGAGKTTFLKLITGELLPDEGKISFLKTDRLGYLPQVINLNDDRLVYDYIYSARPIEKYQGKAKLLENQMAQVKSDSELKILFNEYDNVRKYLDYWEEYSADSTLRKITKGLNISEEMLNLPVMSLSGGEKSKVAFAKLLFEKPNIILLDEPTNHLDTQSKDWVINYLKDYKGCVLIISHDIKFLNQITDKTLLVDKLTHSLQLFNGNYNKFTALYEEYKLTINREVKAQEEKEKKLVDFITRAEGGSGKMKKLAKSREKELEKLRENKIEEIKANKSAKITIKSSGNSAKCPLEIKNVSFGYNKSKPLIKNLSVSLNDKEKLLIAGNNGVGKSTLLKLIMNELKPITGEIFKNPKTKIAYYDQEQKNLFGDETILEHFISQGLTQKEIRGMLGRFLFYGNDVNKKLSVLSPGERCRVAFAQIALQDSNMIILDEPTNHLDPTTQKLIASNFHDYDGAMLLVSHNPEFVEDLEIDKMLILPEQKMLNYDRTLLEKIQKNNEKKVN